MARALVTGATGFLGGAVLAELGARGHDPVALVRRPDQAERLGAAGIRSVAGELGDGPALRRAVAETDPDWVFHLAAEIATQRRAARVREVNVEGTRRVIEACAAAPPEKLLFASTVVTGEAHGALLTEQSELPRDTAYGRSKGEGEEMVLGSGLDGVVIRPSHVYGPGGWYADTVKRIRKGTFAIPGDGRNLWDVVRVEDVATAFVLAAESAPGGSVFHVVDDKPVALEDFIGLTATALGKPGPRHVPRFVARLAVGRPAVEAAVRSARSSNELIKRELGWAPRYPTAELGVPDAVRRIIAEEGPGTA